MVENCGDKSFAEAEISTGGPHIHAPELCLVRLLRTFLRSIARYSHEHVVKECAENIRAGYDRLEAVLASIAPAGR